MKLPFTIHNPDYPNMLKMEHIDNKISQRIKCAWYCLIGKAVAISYVVNPYLESDS